MKLEMWTIYDSPRDMPGFFVARRWIVEGTGHRPTDETLANKRLESLRTLFEEWGLTCITRSPEDEPQIVETWL